MGSETHLVGWLLGAAVLLIAKWKIHILRVLLVSLRTRYYLLVTSALNEEQFVIYRA